MAGSNRNRHRKLPLNEAWKHYWSTIFPNGIDWQTDLEAELEYHLCFPGDAEWFSRERPQREIPSWSDDVTIRIHNDAVSMEFNNTEFGTIPLFINNNVPVPSNWQANNPFAKATYQSVLKDRKKTQCRDFFQAVVLTCGNKIQHQLLREIKQINQPKFETLCRSSNDVFAAEVKLPAFALKEIDRVDIPNNNLKDRLGSPIYCHVHIKQLKPSKSEAGPRGSFHNQDAVLVEEMKSLIDEDQVSSVRQAAQRLCHKAPKRNGGTEESVEIRLQKKFSQKYPSYTNRRGSRAQ